MSSPPEDVSTVGEQNLAAFRSSLREQILRHGTADTLGEIRGSLMSATEVLRDARAGTGTKSAAVRAAAHVASTFPETKRGSTAERVRAGTRLITAGARLQAVGPGDVAIDLALVIASLWSGDPFTAGRRRLVGGLFALAEQLPDEALGATLPAGETTVPAPDLGEETMAAFEVLASELALELSDAGRQLAEAGEIPGEELIDRTDDLRRLAVTLHGGPEEPVTLQDVRAARQAALRAANPIVTQASELARLEGPEESTELIEQIRSIARDAGSSEAAPTLCALVKVLHTLVSDGADAGPDLHALESIEDELFRRDISPMALLRVLADLRFGGDAPPGDVAACGVAEPSLPTELDPAPPLTSDFAPTPEPEVPAADPAEPEVPCVSDVSTEAVAETVGASPGAEATAPLAPSGASSDERDGPPHDHPRQLGQEDASGADFIALSSRRGRDPDTTPTPSAAAIAEGTRPPQPIGSISEDLLADLVELDPMLGALLVRAEQGAEDLAGALEALALSRALGGADGDAATVLDRLLLDHDERRAQSRNDGPLIAAATIGLALHAPTRSPLRNLAQPPSELSYSPALVHALQGIFNAVTRGALSREHVDAAVRQAALEQRMLNVVAQAGTLRAELPERESRHAPAKRTWRALIHPQGELGTALGSIADSTATEADIQRLLHAWDDFDSRLNAVCSEFGSGREKVVSGVRGWLAALVNKVLALAREWLQISRQRAAATGEQLGRGRQQLLAEQRKALSSSIDDAAAEVTVKIGALDGLEAACWQALLDRFDETRAAIDGQWLTTPDLSANDIRQAPLARAWELTLDAQGRPQGEPREVIAALVRAKDRDPTEAVGRQIHKGNLQAARAALNAIAVDASVETVDGLEDHIMVAQRERADADDRRTGDVALQTARLLRIGIIDAAEHARIEGVLRRPQDAAAERFDLRERALDDLVAMLETAESSRRSELSTKLENTAASEDDRQQIVETLGRGDLAVAEDQVLRLERGERLTSLAVPRLLEPFLAAVHTSAPTVGVIVDALANGTDIPGFPCSQLEESVRHRTRRAIAAADTLARAVRQRQTKDQAIGDHLRSIGEVAGLDIVAGSLKQSARAPRGLAHATVDLIPGVARWRPPHHVSPDGPRQRRTHQVVIWEGAPVAEMLASLAANPGLPALVIATGPLSVERRRQLERQARRGGASFLLVDAYVLLHAAIVGAQLGVPPLAIVIATSMAMGKINPYTAAGAVHHEMFMGRREESANVRDFGRAATLYGGRQLGKSALLRDLERSCNDPGDDQRAAVVRARYIDLKREGVGDRLPPESVWPVIATSLARAGLKNFHGRSGRDEVVRAIEEHLSAPLGELRLFLDEADEFLSKESRTGFPNVYNFRQLVEDHPDRFKVVFAGLHSVNRFRRIPNQPLAQLGSPERIGPLKWDEARELVLIPLETLGYRFEDEALVDLMLVETRRHANLIQFACKRLIDHVSARAEEHGESAPLLITRDDLAEIFERDAEFREWLRDRFELTLNLYRPYKILALLLAMEAHADDDVRLEGLSLRDLERLASEWWPEGFADMTPDEFSVVVEEMENLEVLALNSATGKYRLPSVNLIRLLGGSDEIERHLIAEIERPLDDVDDGAQHDRRKRDTDGHSALTYDDERLIFGPTQRPLTIALGNMALGVEGLTDDIALAGNSPEWHRDVTRRTLNVGDALPRSMPETVVAARVRPSHRSLPELEQWISKIAGELTDDRRVVLVFADEWLPRWQDVIDHVEMASPEAAQVLVLKRWNRGAFRRWLEELGVNAERADQWFAATGGFPVAAGQLNADMVADEGADDRERVASLAASSSGLDRYPLAARILKLLAVLELGDATELRDMLDEPVALADADGAARVLVLLGLARLERDGYVINEQVPAMQTAAAL